jgi:16S rRNA (guanine527-N7)-methyltransferase
MRKPAIQPLVTGKTETPPERHFHLASDDEAAAAEARRALETLLADLPTLERSLPAGFLDLAERFVALLLTANRRTNLTRVTSPADIARLHLLDSLAALRQLDEIAPEEAIDLGSGGGLPALPLAMARPGVSWTLVDSVRKKAAALVEFADAFRMPNVTVVADERNRSDRRSTGRRWADLVTAGPAPPFPVLAELRCPARRSAARSSRGRGRSRRATTRSGAVAWRSVSWGAAACASSIPKYPRSADIGS